MKKVISLIVSFLLCVPVFGMETGRFGPTVATGATLTIAAVGGAGSSGAQDRNCLTFLAVDSGSGYGPANTAVCTFTVASASNNLFIISISTASPTPVVMSWPAQSNPAASSQSGYGNCGVAGQTVTVTAANCGSSYHISAQGYTDR